ncbi:hypothetical protein OGAPHI_002134 [Ogataea philodendri]|uniref:Uncharacterized protein n=1 Tax=Ogataea philodendri TaxID=1378263 RepID=A0A9P8PB83_9ASCO|nr:uncharacterized protein OGAPHI_002134 [Ogataea philodendri]KAH3668380.1 hypothetical protein OGAPHI_002134 [Ogataea philodendri]
MLLVYGLRGVRDERVVRGVLGDGFASGIDGSLVDTSGALSLDGRFLTLLDGLRISNRKRPSDSSPGWLWFDTIGDPSGDRSCKWFEYSLPDLPASCIGTETLLNDETRFPSRAELRNDATDSSVGLRAVSAMSVLNDGVDANCMFWSSCGESRFNDQLFWSIDVAVVDRVSTDPLYWWP